MKPNAGDVYCVYNHRMQKYTACQITKVYEEMKRLRANMLILNWSGDAILRQEELSNIKPLVTDFFYYNECLSLVNVEASVPGNYIFVGNIAPLTDQNTNTYFNWDDGDVYRQLKWLEIPEEKRREFKRAMKSTEITTLAGQEIGVNTHIVIDSKFAYQNMRELNVLPCLSTIECERWHPDLYEFLEANPFIIKVTLKGHKQRVLDFRKTHIRRLDIEMDGVEELYLNDEMEDIHLCGDINHPFQIFAKENGKNLLADFGDTVKLDCGIKNLSYIDCVDVKEIDLAVIAQAYPNLMELRLWGNPGYIRNFDAIKKLKQLSFFTTVDLFGFTADDIPKPEEMPHLVKFWMSSLAEDAAKAAKQLYQENAKNGLDLWIEKARKPEWLKENMDNPFRSWDGQEAISSAAAKRAAAQYRKTRSEILALLNQQTSDFSGRMKAIVTEYTETFSKMEKRKNFIETVEREEIFKALSDLLDLVPSEAGMDKDELLDLFDAIRDY